MKENIKTFCVKHRKVLNISKNVLLLLGIAYLLIRVPIISNVIEYISKIFVVINTSGIEGAKFVFGEAFMNSYFVFAIQVLIPIIPFCIILGLLQKYGVTNFLIKTIGGFTEKVFGINRDSAYVSVANTFLSDTVAPNIIKNKFDKLLDIDKAILFVSGLASAGCVIWGSYAGILAYDGVFTDIIITAILSPIACFVFVELVYKNKKNNSITVLENESKDSIIGTITEEAIGGFAIIKNICIMLIAYMSLVYIIGSIVPEEVKSIVAIPFDLLGYLMRADNPHAVGKLIMDRIFLNEFVAFGEASKMSLSVHDLRLVLASNMSFCNISSIGIMMGYARCFPTLYGWFSKNWLKCFVLSLVSTIFVGIVFSFFI